MSELIEEYKEQITVDNEHEVERECVLFRKFIKAHLSTKNFKWFTPTKKGGSMFYNPKIYNDVSLQHVYAILTQKKNGRCNCINDIRNMVKRQGSMFPKSSDFDYRTIFDEKKCLGLL